MTQAVVGVVGAQTLARIPTTRAEGGQRRAACPAARHRSASAPDQRRRLGARKLIRLERPPFGVVPTLKEPG
jgi:hypothetical protein